MKVLDLLLLAKEYVENEEGEVVTFEDGQMAKIKQNQYIQLHSLIGPDAFRTNILIQTILDGNIDDVLAMLVDGPKKERIQEVENKVTAKFNHYCVVTKKLYDSFVNEYQGNKKDFALANRENAMFGVVMSLTKRPTAVTEKMIEEGVRIYLDKITNSLGKATTWIEGL